MANKVDLGSGIIGQVDRHDPGTSVDLKNAQTEAPTIFVDGISGLSMSPHVTKIHFIEHFPGEGGVQGRYVMSLVIANDQLAKTVEVLNGALDQIRVRQEQDRQAGAE